MRRRFSNDTFGQKVISILDDGPPGMHRYPQGRPKGFQLDRKGFQGQSQGALPPARVDVGSGGAVLDTVSASEYGEFRELREVRFCAQARLKRHIWSESDINSR